MNTFILCMPPGGIDIGALIYCVLTMTSLFNNLSPTCYAILMSQSHTHTINVFT